jgi:hypothetical protein
MASTPRPKPSSAFDSMLAPTKKRFDDLYRGGQRQAGEATASTTLFVSRRTATAMRGRAASPKLAADSPAARRLNERCGSDWRFEVAEETRDGDEAIVLGKLTFGRDNAVRTQFGRAQISGNPVAAASGGVRFKIGGSGTEADERDAFRRAAEAALLNCVDLI